MALTPLQQQHAAMPWSITLEDLLALMNLLSDPVEWRIFGSYQFVMVAEIHKAAVTRNLPVPEPFGKHMRALAGSREKFPKIIGKNDPPVLDVNKDE